MDFEKKWKNGAFGSDASCAVSEVLCSPRALKLRFLFIGWIRLMKWKLRRVGKGKLEIEALIIFGTMVMIFVCTKWWCVSKKEWNLLFLWWFINSNEIVLFDNASTLQQKFAKPRHDVSSILHLTIDEKNKKITEHVIHI